MEKQTRFSWMLASGLFMTGVLVGATEYFYRTAVKRTTEKAILERSSDLPELLKTNEEQEEELE
ncbi:hypothetical protein [Shouchella patagoniensis]|uniref:hypothetical protein n=1 Tax=Shouchella patagoniensis TaxID=228576 RepID=UPI000994B893|nr:hypothetical protein [Shouchella patagoniensis]